MPIDTKRNYKVYRHINLQNNKMYIGITKQELNRRWRNGKGYKDNPHFYDAIQKYGWNGFKHELLLCNLTHGEAEMFEIELIKYYKSNHRDFGYNIANGGHTAESISEETREKMRRRPVRKGKDSVWYGRKHTEETKLKISKTRKEKGLAVGENNPMYGKRGEKSPLFGRKHTEEAKMKMSEALKGRVVSEETRRKLSENSWSHKNKGQIVFTEEHRKKIGLAQQGEKHHNWGMGKKIICLNNNQIYNSASWAGRELNLDPSGITKNCRGKLKSVKGFIFQYYNNEDLK